MGGEAVDAYLMDRDRLDAAQASHHHTRGCTVTINCGNRAALAIAIVKLVNCHSHVFVVDQSSGFYLHCSETAYKCLTEDGPWLL